MTTSGSYDRPPYRVPEPPPRLTGPAAWALDALLPWRLARRIYGPFRVFRFTAADAVQLAASAGGPLGAYGQPVVTTLARQAADPLIERLLLPRALLCLGLLAFFVGLFTGDGLLEPVEQGFTSGLLMLLTGPVSLLVACGSLVALARPGTRVTVLRLCGRPLLTALLTAAFCGLFLYWAVNHYDHTPDDPGWLLLVLVLGPWLTVFFGSVLYLINRNAFGVRGHPLVRPLTSVPLAWLTAVAQAVLVDSVEAYPGSTPLPPYWVALFAGPVGVTATAVVEIVLLRRRHGVGFRGPLPGWRPPSRPVAPVPPEIVEHLRADVAAGAAAHWRLSTDRDGVVWATTPATHAGQQVMWPYVPAFTERHRPTLWSEVERTAGPLRAR
ncbi:hypothetical protein E1265_04850 [Streptomyces sp. 8K308]|uniref:hypothetical protein n=1 Tax=Streptomyces sp. 8K308 TaxID=2530388 RepID=UPI0010535399|nr:hypothetical protein [Streptomyces sp. 8K308]TDC26256.1 hypothetical protein E1265_04850 [Streptomyces sp. 8K308]